MIVELLARVDAAGDKDRVVDEFLAAHANLPVIESGRVHFFYRGDVSDLAITGDMTGGFAELPMHPIPGTDLRYRSFDAPTADRWEYVFKSFERPIVDPRNANAVTTPAGERSVITLGGWDEPAVASSCVECPKGRLASIKVAGEEPDASFDITVYLPASYDAATDRTFPLALWTLGSEALEYGRIPEQLDAMLGHSAEPTIAAFLDLPPSYLWEPKREAFGRVMSERILPALQATFRIAPEPERRALVVQQWAIENSLPWLLASGEFGKLAAQSPMMGEQFVDRVVAPNAASSDALEFHLGWCSYDGRNPDGGLDVVAQTRQLAAVLERAGHRVRAVESPGGSNWTGWRRSMTDVLETLFPLASGSVENR